MSSASSVLIGLDLEDFRRLGVRPNECRLTVIRQAAARSSRALAEHQLRAPSEQVALQLSRVATSAYRLLDPRLRRDSIQRAHVGRILPNAIAVVGQTSFVAGSGRRQASNDVPYDTDRLSDAQLVEMLELDPRRIADCEPSWTASLKDEDLIKSTRRSRSLSRARRRLRDWSVPSGLVALSVAAVTVWMLTRPDKAEPKLGLSQQSGLSGVEAVLSASPTSTVPTVDPAAEPESLNASGDGGVTEQSPIAPRDPLGVEAPAIPRVAASGQMLSAEPPSGVDDARNEFAMSPENPAGATPVKSSPVDVDPPERLEDVLAPAVPPSDALSLQDLGLGGVPDKEAAEDNVAKPSADDLAMDALTNSLSNTPGGFLPDPFESARNADADSTSLSADSLSPENPPSQEPSTRESSSEGPSPEQLSDGPTAVEPLSTPDDPPVETSRSFPLPDAELVESAREKLSELVPEYDEPQSVADAKKLVAKLTSMGEGFDVGSPEHWAAHEMIAVVRWQFDDVWGVRRHVRTLTESYQTDGDATLVSAFVVAVDRASSDQTRKHLLHNGLRLAEQTLLNESFDPCDRVIRALSRPADIVDDQDAIEHLAQFGAALVQARRQSEVAERMSAAASAGESVDDAGIAGRYYCLMLRRWEPGIAWLAKATDVRVASIAGLELSLAGIAEPEEIVQLADRWLLQAERESGRTADSMKLHAVELLRSVRDDLSGIDRLQMDRTIEHVESELPEFAIDALVEPPTEEGSPRAARPAVNKDANARVENAGMIGRVFCQDEDMAVRIEYTMGTRVTSKMIREIGTRLGEDLEPATVDLTGSIFLSTPQAVVVRLVGAGNSKLWVGDDLVSVVEDRPVTLDLEAGTHAIRWAFQPGDEQPSALRIFNAASEPLTVQRPDESGQILPRTILTVGIR